MYTYGSYSTAEKRAYAKGCQRGREEMKVKLAEADAKIRTLMWVVAQLGVENDAYEAQ